jgi:hypothetical protein
MIAASDLVPDAAVERNRNLQQLQRLEQLLRSEF